MARKNTSIQVSQNNWKPKRIYHQDKYGSELKQNKEQPFLTREQIAYRSGYLKAVKDDAELFKYGAAKYQGLDKKSCQRISRTKGPHPEISGVKAKREFYKDK